MKKWEIICHIKFRRKRLRRKKSSSSSNTRESHLCHTCGEASLRPRHCTLIFYKRATLNLHSSTEIMQDSGSKLQEYFTKESQREKKKKGLK